MSPSRERREAAVAVIGMACRFPGARDVEQFWDNLRRGVEAEARVDLEDWAKAVDGHPAYFDRPEIVPARPRLEGVDLFDAGFFGYTDRDAQILDPQQRFFLECAWEALENAGYDSERFRGDIGVCAGVSQSSYLINLLQWDRELSQNMGNLSIGIGNMNDSLATRVAYKLNLTGPAFAVQCFCSTSLVAVHLACQSLLSRDADMVLAGGVTIVVPQEVGYLHREGGILSPDGHTRSFDARGGGMVFGNGVGIVVLKRLEDAIADRDDIRAVILGSAINNDGSLKVGYTAPSVVGQSKVIEKAIQASGVDPETIRYLEAHGTATSLGDPAEVSGLTKAFRKWTDRKGFCGIGSVKTNIGHLDSAAGVAGLIKAVLALEREQIPPSLHYERPNPEIDFAESPFFVVRELTPWKRGELPRRCGVSSFGFGGTNAHVILEEAPSLPATDPPRPWQLLVLSAKSPSALDRATENLAARLSAPGAPNLADVAYTLQVGRRLFNHRRVVLCRDLEDARSALSDPGRWETSYQHRYDAPVAFLFSGQGSQYVNMGKGLLGEEAFRRAVEECCAILAERAGIDLAPILYPEGELAGESAERLQQTRLTQPALFVIEYALARLWMSLGILPSAMIGHSIGEYVAAHLAGVFSLEDALILVAERGRLMQSVPHGTMLAVTASREALESYLGSEVCLAAVNAPSLSVLSGPTEAIERVETELADRGVMSRRLHTSHAFHSSMMDPILDEFRRIVERTERRSPQIRFVSNLTGAWITDEQVRDPEYWARHLRRPVQFAEGLRTLAAAGQPALLEVGPGNTLASLARQQGADSGSTAAIATLRHPKDGREDRAVLLQALGRLWAAGVAIDGEKIHAGERRRRLALPAYPFERRRFWVPVNPQMKRALEVARGASYRRQEPTEWFFEPSWQRSNLPESADARVPESSSWLLFCDETGIGDRMAQELAQRARAVTTVRMGERFEQSAPEDFILNPAAPADYDRLLEALAGSGKAPTHVAHLWNLTPEDEPAIRLPGHELERTQDRGFYSLLFLAQAIGRIGVSQPLAIGVVANQMQEVVGGELTRPEKATVIGPCKVMSSELKQVTCGSIDVELPRTEPERRGLARRLVAEIATGEANGSLVAYRGRHRWVSSAGRIALPAPNGVPALRDNGVYWITGGMGGIGLVFAEHLARKYRARLVLTGRSGLPAREEWPRWLERGATDPTSRRIAAVQKLEALGSEVLCLSADAADLAGMTEALRRARERFGGVHGVIHAAGLPGGGIIQLKKREEAARVMAPKLQGTLVLDALFGSEPLDFLVLCSSTAAWVGGFGQVDYCAANAFLDAFAHRPPREGGPRRIVSIDWDTWKDVGMAVETEVTGAMKAVRDVNLKLGITAEEGAAALETALASGLPQLAVFTVDITPQLLRRRLVPARRDDSEREAESPAETSAETAAADGEVTDLEKTIAETWQKVLGPRPIAAHDNFFELGGDSLTAIQVISLLKKRLGEEIPVVKFYEAPTVALLAKSLRAEAGDSKPVALNEVERRAETRLALMKKRRQTRDARPVSSSR